MSVGDNEYIECVIQWFCCGPCNEFIGHTKGWFEKQHQPIAGEEFSYYNFTLCHFCTTKISRGVVLVLKELFPDEYHFE